MTGSAATDAKHDETAAEHARGLFGKDGRYVLLLASQVLLVSLSTPVLTRLLGTRGFGIIGICLPLAQLIAFVGQWGLPLAAQRYFAAGGLDRAREVVGVSLVIGLALGALALLTVPVWGGALSLNIANTTLRLTVFYSCALALTQTPLAVLRSTDRVGAFALVVLIQTVVAEVISVLLVLFVHRTAEQYMLGELIGQGAALACALRFVRPRIVLGRRRTFDLAAFRSSGNIAATTVASFVLAVADRVIVNADLGHRATARYTVASNVGGFGLILMYSITEAWMPRILSIGASAERARAMGLARDILLVLAGIGSLALAAVSIVLLKLWVPSAYAPDHLQLVVTVIVTTSLPLAATLAYTTLLTSLGHIRIGLAGTLCSVVLNIGLNLVLVPSMGIAGSALATFVSYTVGLVVVVMMARRIIRLPSVPGALVVRGALLIGAAFAVIELPVTDAALVGRLLLGMVCVLCGLSVLAVAIGRSPWRWVGRIAGAVGGLGAEGISASSPSRGIILHYIPDAGSHSGNDGFADQ